MNVGLGLEEADLCIHIVYSNSYYICVLSTLQKFKQRDVTELSLWHTEGKVMFRMTPALPSPNVSSSPRTDDERVVVNNADAAR